MDLTFAHSLADLISERLRSFEPVGLDLKGRRHAAVAFTLVKTDQPAGIGNLDSAPARDDEAAFLLTTRAARLSSHAGQRAFPGGGLDRDESVERAALRELHEEVGLDLGEERILGRLDDYPTRSGFVISPVVVWGECDVPLRANPDEVAQIHHIPLRELLRDEAPMLESIAESEHPVLKMPLGDDWMAAPSAAIAFQFREVALLGRATRVSHFEQPRFAWK